MQPRGPSEEVWPSFFVGGVARRIGSQSVCTPLPLPAEMLLAIVDDRTYQLGTESLLIKGARLTSKNNHSFVRDTLLRDISDDNNIGRCPGDVVALELPVRPSVHVRIERRWNQRGPGTCLILHNEEAEDNIYLQRQDNTTPQLIRLPGWNNNTSSSSSSSSICNRELLPGDTVLFEEPVNPSTLPPVFLQMVEYPHKQSIPPVIVSAEAVSTRRRLQLTAAVLLANGTSPSSLSKKILQQNQVPVLIDRDRNKPHQSYASPEALADELATTSVGLSHRLDLSDVPETTFGNTAFLLRHKTRGLTIEKDSEHDSDYASPPARNMIDVIILSSLEVKGLQLGWNIDDDDEEEKEEMEEEALYICYNSEASAAIIWRSTLQVSSYVMRTALKQAAKNHNYALLHMALSAGARLPTSCLTTAISSTISNVPVPVRDFSAPRLLTLMPHLIESVKLALCWRVIRELKRRKEILESSAVVDILTINTRFAFDVFSALLQLGLISSARCIEALQTPSITVQTISEVMTELEKSTRSQTGSSIELALVFLLCSTLHRKVEAANTRHQNGSRDEDHLILFMEFIATKLSMTKWLHYKGEEFPLLHWLCEEGSPKSVSIFIQQFPMWMNVTNKIRSTALHIAAEARRPDVLEILTDKATTREVNSTNDGNVTPLNYAVKNDDEASVRALLLAKADPTRRCGPNGYGYHDSYYRPWEGTAMRVALRHRSTHVVSELLEAGVPVPNEIPPELRPLMRSYMSSCNFTMPANEAHLIMQAKYDVADFLMSLAIFQDSQSKLWSHVVEYVGPYHVLGRPCRGHAAKERQRAQRGQSSSYAFLTCYNDSQLWERFLRLGCYCTEVRKRVAAADALQVEVADNEQQAQVEPATRAQYDNDEDEEEEDEDDDEIDDEDDDDDDDEEEEEEEEDVDDVASIFGFRY